VVDLREDRRSLLSAIDARLQQAVDLSEEILHVPELGYREFQTSDLLAQALEGLGMSVARGIAMTGVRAEIGDSSRGPTLAVIGELDAIRVPEHPLADPDTGAAHACGHNAQIGVLLAIAAGLVEAGLADTLNGRVVFVGVPSEESTEIPWKLQARSEGRLEFFGGKQELLRLGVFDDVDFALLTHSTSTAASDFGPGIAIAGAMNGHLIKYAEFIGRSAHAGVAPHLGVNALKAALVAISAMDAHRESFRDEDAIRVHPILTHHGGAVNVVPSDVALEMYVRARNIDALKEANEKVNRALRGGAVAIGTRLKSVTLPGYLPLAQENLLVQMAKDNALLLDLPPVPTEPHTAATNDVGDLSTVVPTLQISTGGTRGSVHSKEFFIDDHDVAIRTPARVLALTLLDALDLNREDIPSATSGDHYMSREAYLELVRSLAEETEFDGVKW
jgi:amidohydrolase